MGASTGDGLNDEPRDGAGNDASAEWAFDTRAIHVGQEPEPLYGSVNVPIYQTSTFEQDEVGRPKRWDYARGGNPTREAFETALASLESGDRCFAFSSGMGAEATLLLALRPGDHVVLSDEVYGGTYRLLARVMEPWGLTWSVCDLGDEAALGAALRPKTRLVWIETPSNPTLKIVDIAAVSALAHRSGATVVVDNTFATPALQRPLTIGADVVVHSVTKYVGGHSDLIGGAVVTSDEAWIDRLGFLVNAVGAVPAPVDSYLALRGLKTLGIRMRRHSENASTIASFLAGHRKVKQVYYPGLPTHPGADVAARQMDAFGGIVSFTLFSAAEALEVARRTKLFFLAESLGGVESLIEVPGPMTHASAAGSDLEVPPELVRLSVGIEDVEDLLRDLSRALEA
jgi:cystathionine gamma-synthase